MQKTTYLHYFGELTPYLDQADVVDVKCFEGAASLRGLIAAMLSYHPWWLVILYRIREIPVSVLGLVKHEKPAALPAMSPEDLSFAPGDRASFFTVRAGQEESFWVAESPDDKHLKAYFGVVKEPLDGEASRFHVVTTVTYKHWTGPVYFNLIRPFHHLVVARMARYGLSA